jgi:hypothetical protein
MFLHYFIHNMRIEAVLSRSQQAAIKVLKKYPLLEDGDSTVDLAKVWVANVNLCETVLGISWDLAPGYVRVFFCFFLSRDDCSAVESAYTCLWGLLFALCRHVARHEAEARGKGITFELVVCVCTRGNSHLIEGADVWDV